MKDSKLIGYARGAGKITAAEQELARLVLEKHNEIAKLCVENAKLLARLEELKGPCPFETKWLNDWRPELKEYVEDF